MNWKTFADWRKIVIFIILVAISFLIKLDNSLFGCFDYCPPEKVCIQVCSDTPLFYAPLALFIGSRNVAANLILFIPMLIFWYLISYIVIWIYDKFKKRKP